VKINDKIVSTQRRKYCYECSPFGSGNNHLLKGNKTDEQKKAILDLRKRNVAKLSTNSKRFGGEKEKTSCFKNLAENAQNVIITKVCGRLNSTPRPKHKKFCLSVFGYTCSWDEID
jgi:hypothetical protein